MTPVVKLTYLLGALDGEAKRSVSMYDVRAENYEEVRKVLDERLGRTRILIRFGSTKAHHAPKGRKQRLV